MKYVHSSKGIAENEKKYFIVTHGCQMNEHDSEKIAGILENMGYIKGKGIEDANIVLYNTCTVREGAEEKVYGKLGYIKHLKKSNPDLLLGICGCMAQSSKEKILAKAPYVDLIFGTHNIHQLPQLLEQALERNGTVVEVWDDKGDEIPEVPVTREGNYKAYIAITFGCNNFCSYCIVPYVRGREKSRSPEEILKEVTQLASEGYKEIMLLGQNVNSYGKDLNGNYGFIELLQDINKIDGIERIRYMTSHPRDFSVEMVDIIKNLSKVCEHFHLPIQSGSNRILKAMNRGYTKEHYLELTEKIRKDIPNATITTDIIVGFPGETEEDFQETLEVVNTVKYDAAFTFMYSPRTGTPAATMVNQVDKMLKKERLQRLINLQEEITQTKNKEMVGKVYEVLVEGISKNNPNRLSGRTRGNKVISFEGDMSLVGTLVQIEVKKALAHSLIGEIK